MVNAKNLKDSKKSIVQSHKSSIKLKYKMLPMNWGLPEIKLMDSGEKVEGKTPLIVILKLFVAKAPEEPKNLYIKTLKPTPKYKMN